MNIVFLSFGHVDSISALSKSLARRGHKVTLFLVVFDDRYINSIVNFDLKNLEFGIHPLDELKGTSEETDLFISYLKNDADCNLLKLPSRSLKDFKNVKFIKNCAEQIKEIKPDVIYFNGDSPHTFLFYFLLRGIPMLSAIHDFIPHTGTPEPLKNKVFRYFQLKLNFVFIQHSKHLKDLFLQKTGLKDEQVKVLYFAPFDIYYSYMKNGKVEPEASYPGSIMFLGRIEKYKGIEYLCKAIEKINPSFPSVKYYFLGKGDYYFDIEYYKAKYSIEVVNNYIDNAALADYMQKISFVVLPYTDATQSGVVMTAYSFNKPVIATKVGGIPEVVIEGETGYLVEPKNDEEIAEKLLFLLKNPSYVKELEENIKTLKMNGKYSFMNWDNVAIDAENIFNEIISRN